MPRRGQTHDGERSAERPFPGWNLASGASPPRRLGFGSIGSHSGAQQTLQSGTLLPPASPKVGTRVPGQCCDGTEEEPWDEGSWCLTVRWEA